MNPIAYTLVTDGPSDQVLMHPIDWLLSQHGVQVTSRRWADLRQLHPPPKGLSNRILSAVNLYPCDILFIHRDAENQPREVRVNEIRGSLATTTPAVCVVPVRMTEAWYLFDEPAIRRAASNPHGKVHLQLPSAFESLPNPKALLQELLTVATERSGRMRQKFRPEAAYYRLAELIRDYSPLRQLPAFQAFEHELTELLQSAA